MSGEERLSALILNKTVAEDCFEIKYRGKLYKLGIRPLSGKTIIEVSEQIAKCSPIVDNGQSVFHALIENASDLRHIARAIAIATEAKNVNKITKVILDLEASQIEQLWEIVERNADGGFFLRIMTSAKNLNLTKKTTQE